MGHYVMFHFCIHHVMSNQGNHICLLKHLMLLYNEKFRIAIQCVFIFLRNITEHYFHSTVEYSTWTFT